MGRQERQELVGPFHHRHAVTVKELLQPHVEELPDGGHHIAGLELLAQYFADPPGLLGAPALVPDLQAWTLRIAAGMASRMSPAINPSSPLASRARSPARPWRYTAASSASAGPIARLRKAPTIPVSTSPDPPLAIPGFPVGFR